jgi:hypothetical protein
VAVPAGRGGPAPTPQPVPGPVSGRLRRAGAGPRRRRHGRTPPALRAARRALLGHRRGGPRSGLPDPLRSSPGRADAGRAADAGHPVRRPDRAGRRRQDLAGRAVAGAPAPCRPEGADEDRAGGRRGRSRGYCGRIAGGAGHPDRVPGTPVRPRHPAGIRRRRAVRTAPRRWPRALRDADASPLRRRGLSAHRNGTQSAGRCPARGRRPGRRDRDPRELAGSPTRRRGGSGHRRDGSAAVGPDRLPGAIRAVPAVADGDARRGRRLATVVASTPGLGRVPARGPLARGRPTHPTRLPLALQRSGLRSHRRRAAAGIAQRAARRGGRPRDGDGREERQQATDQQQWSGAGEHVR